MIYQFEVHWKTAIINVCVSIDRTCGFLATGSVSFFRIDVYGRVYSGSVQFLN
jgi:hypothetical protein